MELYSLFNTNCVLKYLIIKGDHSQVIFDSNNFLSSQLSPCALLASLSNSESWYHTFVSENCILCTPSCFFRVLIADFSY